MCRHVYLRVPTYLILELSQLAPGACVNHWILGLGLAWCSRPCLVFTALRRPYEVEKWNSSTPAMILCGASVVSWKHLWWADCQRDEVGGLPRWLITRDNDLLADPRFIVV